MTGTPLIAALATATLSGCGHSSPAKETRPTAVHQKTATAAQLRDELLSAPTGSKPDHTIALAPRSTLDLDQFVRGMFVAKSITAEKEYLQEQGFVHAAETNWDAADGTGAVIFLIKFRGAAEARGYVDSLSASMATSASALAGLPDGRILTADSADSYGDIVMQARFTVGDIAVEMHYYSHATADRAGLTALAQAQYARLTKSSTTA
ncbi:hypothetical protein ACH47Z_33330 [Streptomyces sp. NPDC020192]|uniref:hypothetical protein n=1 Tax=Streptomyces sp. NPDC020192 TaxID=3365066 RepID=UPI0037A53C87